MNMAARVHGYPQGDVHHPHGPSPAMYQRHPRGQNHPSSPQQHAPYPYHLARQPHGLQTQRPQTQPQHDPHRRPLSQLSNHQMQPRMMPTTPLHHSPATSPHQAIFAPRPQMEGPANRSYDQQQQHTGRYQPSRGAQRDAKWHARYAERSHLAPQPTTQPHPGWVPPPHPAPMMRPGPPRPTNMKRVRQDQQAIIAAARRAHAESMAKEQAKAENDRKVRRIQLQVFVHARQTHCLWDGCEAVLNSWALLEKHILHCHLKSTLTGSDSDNVPCKWADCMEKYPTNNACYQHCLVDHMAAYSARCPFNCLYEGPKFSELMAHIGRRHPKATPEDFVPGLIHHKPLYLPSSIDDLPKLPHFASITGDLASTNYRTPDVRPYPTPISLKVRNMVSKKCVRGRRPRKENFVDKRGACAAIGAMIENSRRISIVCQSATNPSEQAPGVTSSTPAPLSAKEAVEIGVQLVDIRKSFKEAKEVAKKEVINDSVFDTEGDTSSASGDSKSSSRAPGRPKIRVRISDVKPSKQDMQSLAAELSDSESESSESSMYSEYRASRAIVTPTGVSPDGEAIKRSERLKRKAVGSDGVISDDGPSPTKRRP